MTYKERHTKSQQIEYSCVCITPPLAAHTTTLPYLPYQ